MTPTEITTLITARLPGVAPRSSWGETSLFYNPGQRLAHGVYFCTLKEHDGPNDRASQLHRPGVFRLAIGLGPQAYTALFGARPARPAKGQAVSTGHDFTELDLLMPHPVYAWMGWAQVLSPSASKLQELIPHIEDAHRLAVMKFQRATARLSR